MANGFSGLRWIGGMVFPGGGLGTWVVDVFFGTSHRGEWPRAKPPAGGPFQRRISGLVTKIQKAPAA